MISTTSGCEIVTTRIVDAGIAKVWLAWTDPEHLKAWWGPGGFTNTFTKFDLRPGGKWSFTMHGPDKGNYINECEFIRVEKPGFISWKRFSKPLFQVHAQFQETAVDKTKIIYRMIFDTASECDKVKGFAGAKNDENFDRLEMELLKIV